jgi:hypothetical protein
MEDLMLTTSKAFEEVKLSVELMTNMYKVSHCWGQVRHGAEKLIR